MRPIDVSTTNEKLVYNNLFSKTKLTPNKINTGDKVRRVYDMKAFDKGYYPSWTDQIFTVENTIKGDKQYVFKLRDEQGNILEQRFYPQELQQITDNLYRIEKVIKKRKRRGKTEYFVKWLNYPESYNSWTDNIENVS
ncbi:uncharacterized protein LOC128954155 [Oppia nitens]|nr:uncharacterized protein LOC128954155 [Oppia nitens]